jgi:hypothetical protein
MSGTARAGRELVHHYCQQKDREVIATNDSAGNLRCVGCGRFCEERGKYDTETDYEVRTDGGQHEPTAVDGSSTESRSATRRSEVDDSSTRVLEDVEQELVEKATRAATVAGTTGHERERARVATATALVANCRWHADNRDHDGFRGALAAAARDVVEATGFTETGQYGEDTSVIDTLVRAQCAATDLDLLDPEFQVEVDESSTDGRGTGGQE